MPARLTRTVYLFKTAQAVRVYENKNDAMEDLQMCREITGMEPEFEILDIPMVLQDDASAFLKPEKAPARKKVEYSPAFETFWESVEPKRKKAEVYKSWLESNHGYVATTITG
jgi:hypothetical protein